MSKSKPLLFIDTVYTEFNHSTGQTVFDSRKRPKKETPKKEKVISEDEKNLQTTVEELEVLDQTHAIHEVNEPPKPKKSSKLQQQVYLLDRRTKLNHFVLVEIERSDDKPTTGLFKGFIDHTIQLASEEDEIIEIPFDSVVAIHILKV